MLPSLLASPTRRAIDPGTDVNAVIETVDTVFAGPLAPTRRATITGQGSGNTLRLRGVGENAADGADYGVLVAYTTATVGAAGGPAAGDDVLLYAVSPGHEIVLGKVVH